MKTRGPVLVKDFGDGWASKAATDYIRVLVTLAGYDLMELLKTINLIHRKHVSRNINIKTVERAVTILDEILGTHKKED